MADTNNDRVGKALELLKTGLAPFVSREFINQYKGQSASVLQQRLDEPIQDAQRPFHSMDAAALLRVMWEWWNDVYRNTLGPAERSLVSELRDVCNRWVRQDAVLHR